MPWCRAMAGGVVLALQITPNAKKTEVVGIFDNALKLKLQAQPIDGKANEALIKYLAKTLGVARSAVSITRGETSRKKTVEIVSSSLTPDEVQRLLLGPGEGPA
ncbi:MAG: DUF167 domain-containing protein [Massilia sp.]